MKKACYFGAGFVPNALWNYAYNFDGSTNYLERTSNFTGIADSSKGIISCFIYDGHSSERLFFSNGSFMDISFDATPRLVLNLSSSGAARTISARTDASILTGSAWNHLLISWDYDFGLGLKLLHCYVNDTNANLAITSGDGAAMTIAYSEATAWALGADTAGGGKITDCLAQFYFYPGQYLDFSNSANRRKFSSAGFAPIFIGRTGENPIGTTPLVYLTSSVGNIGLNSGTGGNFDTLHGTFSACGSTP